MMNKIRMAVVYWILICSFFWSFGCSPKHPVTPEVKPPEEKVEQSTVAVPEIKYYTHTIKWSGENLMRISGWYTGSVRNWVRIVETNPSIDPRRIKIGDSILIPEDLLKTSEPMPVSYRAPGSSPKTKEPDGAAESLPKTDEIELFGPIDTETQSDIVEETGLALPLETIE